MSSTTDDHFSPLPVVASRYWRVLVLTGCLFKSEKSKMGEKIARGCGLRNRNLEDAQPTALPCPVLSKPRGHGVAASEVGPPLRSLLRKLRGVGYRRKRLHRVMAHRNGMVKPNRTENYGRQRGEAAIRQWHIDQPCRDTAGVPAMVTTSDRPTTTVFIRTATRASPTPW